MHARKNVFYLVVMILVGGCLAGPKASAAAPDKITVAYSFDTVPFQFIDDQLKPAGIIIDLWRLWSEKTGVTVEFKGAPWGDTIAMVREGEADVHAGMNYNEVRSQHFDFGDPLLKSNSYFFFHKNIYALKALPDLAPFRIGVLVDSHEAELIRRSLPDATLIAYESQNDLYDAVKRGAIKVFADVEQMAIHALNQRGIAGDFRHNLASPLDKNAFYPVVRRGNPIIGLIQKGFQDISTEEKAAIEREWIASQAEDTLIVACERNYPPFSRLDVDGSPVGLFVDLWRLWAQKTGRQVEFLMLDWADTLAALKDGVADFHSGLFNTNRRSEWIRFSDPIYEMSSALFYMPRYGHIAAAQELAGQKVGALRDSFQAEFIRKHYPEIDLVEFESFPFMYEAVDKGLIKAFMEETLAMKDRMFRQNRLGQFKALNAPRLRNRVYAGVLKNNRELMDVINAGLNQITEQEWRELEKSWIVDPADRRRGTRRRQVKLTKEEEDWLISHPVIRLGVVSDWAPYSFIDDKGKFAGVSADIARIVSAQLGVTMEIVPNLTWPAIIESVKKGTVDVIAAAGRTDDRDAFLRFSEIYLSTPAVVITRKDDYRFVTRDAIRGKTVALVRGQPNYETLLQEYPDIKRFWLPTVLEALQAVSSGRADATVGVGENAAYLASRHNITNLKTAAVLDDAPDGQRFAVRKDWPELVGMLNKALATIPETERATITSRWLQGDRTDDEGALFTLSAEEKRWLAAHPTMRLGVDPLWPPFEFFNETKQYAGIASDYVNLISTQLGVTMAPIRNLSWQKVIDKARSGEIDILPCVAKTPQRSKFLNFSEPYLSFPIVILTRDDAPFISSILDFDNDKVAVVKGYAIQEILERDYPNLKLHMAEDIEKAIKNVSLGRVDAFVGNLASITYTTQKMGLSNLKVGMTTPYKLELSVGIRKDWPELVPIIDKSLGAVSEQTRSTIHNRWINVRFESRIDWVPVVQIVGSILLAGTLVVIIFIRWNRALAREIKDRKRAEEKIRQSEQLQAQIIDFLPDPTWVVDTDGRVMAWNKAIEKLTGVRARDIVGRGDYEYAFPFYGERRPLLIDLATDWQPEFEAKYASLRREGDTLVSENFHPRMGTAGLYLLGTAGCLYDDDGRVTGAIESIRDITDRKLMEDELLEAKILADDANKAKSAFLANMSHEIRTPMNAIIGMSHLALKTDLNPRQRDYIEKIETSANALLGIINDILDFSKIEANKLDIESTDFNLDDVLSNLADLITIKAQKKENLEVLFATEANVPRNLVGDPLRLGQVLINLANNAVKFTETGEIVVSTERVESSDNQVTLKFTVADTGIGLTPDQQSNLFQSFTQADTSTTRKYGGTGLGLSICKRLVEMMGGAIGFESEYGRGSRFFFTSVFQLGSRRHPAAPATPADLRGLKALVVDDNATSRDIFKDMLTSFSFDVTLAASGREGIADLEAAPPGDPYKLLIMDWRMPEMDGIETAGRIRADQRIRHQPVIILVTAHGREEVMRRAASEKLDGCLIKPVSPSILFDTIMEAFGKETTAHARKGVKPLENQIATGQLSGIRVLLVEDNEINQQVASEILAGAGVEVSVAPNGREAVAAVMANTYDAVLMDVQMPVLDGYSATREIRAWEKAGKRRPKKRLPIIAMTAHAMTGDREKSVDAGMDDHVTKPINPDQLFRVLAYWTAHGGAGAAAVAQDGEPSVDDTATVAAREAARPEGSPLPGTLPGFDLEQGVARLQGNAVLYARLLRRFKDQYTDTAADIEAAINRQDLDAARQMAHDLKGIAGNLAALELNRSAAELERLMKAALRGAPPPGTQLDRALKRTADALQTAVEGLTALSEAPSPVTAVLSETAKTDIPPEVLKLTADRLRDAAELGDITELATIADRLRQEFAPLSPIADQVVRLTEEFDFDGIQKLADTIEKKSNQDRHT